MSDTSRSGEIPGGTPSVEWSPEGSSALMVSDEVAEPVDETRQVVDRSVLQSNSEKIQKWFSWAVVAGCGLFVFLTLDPGQILSTTTATGGDMGAHVWGPRFLADHLLPQFRLSGWTQDWYAGFPAYVFYMVVPSLFVLWVSAGPSLWLSPVLLAGLAFAVFRLQERLTTPWARTLMWVMTVLIAVAVVPVPYNVAFKLVTVSGLITLPFAAYVLARATEAPFPVPPLVALSSLGFIYDKGFTILGGNGASTMAGEFAFSISLTFALLYLAVLIKGSRTGRSRALGAVLLALTILCHLIPAIFAGIATVLVLLFLRREDREPWWDSTRAGRVVAGVLVALLVVVLGSDADVPILRSIRGLPGAHIWFPSQWWFPAVASAVGIVLFTGFEPRIVPWMRKRSGWIPAGAVTVVAIIGLVIWNWARGAAILGVLAPWNWSWWSAVLVVLALVTVFFIGFDARVVKWAAVVGPVGGLITAFWALPFLASSTYMNDMGWEKYTRYYDYLLAVPELDSGGMPYRNVVFGLAGLGLVLSLLYRARLGWFLGLCTLVLAWIFRFFPQYRLWNARLLPFYYLALYLLAGLAVGLVIRSLALAFAAGPDERGSNHQPVAIVESISTSGVDDIRRVDELDEQAPMVEVVGAAEAAGAAQQSNSNGSEGRVKEREPVLVGVIGTALCVLVVMGVFLGSFKMLPGGDITTDPKDPATNVYNWGGFDVRLPGFDLHWGGINFGLGIVNDWARWNYSGLENKPAYPEFKGVVSMMDDVSAEHGCGRAFWEYESDLTRYGTTMALMLLPYFTDGCVGSMEGLYFEASSTTPFHFLMQSELSTAPSRAQRELPYSSFDIDKGVEHMQLLGVRYYMATSPQAIEAAESDSQLTKVADKTFTYLDDKVRKSHRWAVFEVADADLVEGLENDPVVVKGVDDHIDGWVYNEERLEPTAVQKAAGIPGSKTPGPAVLWFNDPTKWNVFLATSGPPDWRRSSVSQAQDNQQPNPPVKVSDVKLVSDSVSFDVDRTGVPVLVKVSYFPNWQVDGAEGPYRVSPNFMVVVPNERHVTLSYGYRTTDIGGWLLTLVGVGCVFCLAVVDDRRRKRTAGGVAAAEAQSKTVDVS